jgi:hypothetical protein
MMRLILGLAALVAILLAVAIGLPGHVMVSRSVVINAPESAVYPYLNTMRNFGDWSPWRIRDPNLKMTFSGPEQGKGAHVDWVSEVKAIGQGSMEIVEGEPNRNIDLAVNFNGVEGTSSYALAPSGSGSKLTWSFSYDTGTDPLKRWRGVMLDNLIGPEYQTGLGKLKERIEVTRRPTAPTVTVPPPAEGMPAPVAPPVPGEAAVPGAEVPVQAPDGQQAAPAPAPEAAPAPAPEATTTAPPRQQPRRRSQR